MHRSRLRTWRETSEHVNAGEEWRTGGSPVQACWPRKDLGFILAESDVSAAAEEWRHLIHIRGTPLGPAQWVAWRWRRRERASAWGYRDPLGSRQVCGVRLDTTQVSWRLLFKLVFFKRRSWQQRAPGISYESTTGAWHRARPIMGACWGTLNACWVNEE